MENEDSLLISNRHEIILGHDRIIYLGPAPTGRLGRGYSPSPPTPTTVIHSWEGNEGELGESERNDLWVFLRLISWF